MRRSPTRAGLALAVCLLSVALTGSLRAQDVPSITALAIDTSGSIRPELLEQIKQLAGGVLTALPPGSQVAVFTFNDQSALIQERTNDPAAVEQAIQGLKRGGRFTALYDAIFDASRYLKEAPPARKAIILVTDGLDENSSVQIEDGLKIAVESKIPIYCIGVGKVQEAVMRRIARLTNGEYTSIGATDSNALAQRIAALPAPAPTLAPAPPAMTVAVPASAPASGSNTWIYLLVGTLMVAGAFAAAYLLRKKPEAETPGDKTVAVRDVDEDDGADRTIVMRAPEVGQVERTIMLRLQPSLTITRGSGEGQVFNLSMESAVSIGRAPTNDIPVNDNAVSGEHCRIRPESGAFMLLDLQSTNGTFVNEKRIERHRLSEGDVVRVGETQLLFKMGPS